jgi:hypothetical protein
VPLRDSIDSLLRRPPSLALHEAPCKAPPFAPPQARDSGDRQHARPRAVIASEASDAALYPGAQPATPRHATPRHATPRHATTHAPALTPTAAFLPRSPFGLRDAAPQDVAGSPSRSRQAGGSTSPSRGASETRVSMGGGDVRLLRKGASETRVSTLHRGDSQYIVGRAAPTAQPFAAALRVSATHLSSHLAPSSQYASARAADDEVRDLAFLVWHGALLSTCTRVAGRRATRLLDDLHSGPRARRGDGAMLCYAMRKARRRRYAMLCYAML